MLPFYHATINLYNYGLEIYKLLHHLVHPKRNDHNKMYPISIFQNQFHLFYQVQITLHKHYYYL